MFSTFEPLKPYVGAGLGLTYVNYDDVYPGDGSDTGGSLNAIEGVSIPAYAIARRPNLELTALAGAGRLAQLQATFEWLMDEIKAS